MVDEFSELLTAKPEFVDSFLNIGRVGRSLHVHLLLASQRLEEGKLRGLDTYLSYRIGLRTFSASESRTIIGTADAYTLPQEPGVGFLKSDTENLVQFRAAYVSGRPRGLAGTSVDSLGAATSGPARVEVFTAAAQPDHEERTDAAPASPATPVAEKALDVPDRGRPHEGPGPEAHQVWLARRWPSPPRWISSARPRP